MISKRILGIVVGLGMGVVLACEAGPTASPDDSFRRVEPAADARLDLADASAEKAVALLLAAQNPVAVKPDKPFGGHRTKAVSLLERAREEIAAAKAYADDPKNQGG